MPVSTIYSTWWVLNLFAVYYVLGHPKRCWSFNFYWTVVETRCPSFILPRLVGDVLTRLVILLPLGSRLPICCSLLSILVFSVLFSRRGILGKDMPPKFWAKFWELFCRRGSDGRESPRLRLLSTLSAPLTLSLPSFKEMDMSSSSSSRLDDDMRSSSLSWRMGINKGISSCFSRRLLSRQARPQTVSTDSHRELLQVLLQLLFRLGGRRPPLLVLLLQLRVRLRVLLLHIAEFKDRSLASKEHREDESRKDMDKLLLEECALSWTMDISLQLSCNEVAFKCMRKISLRLLMVGWWWLKAWQVKCFLWEIAGNYFYLVWWIPLQQLLGTVRERVLPSPLRQHHLYAGLLKKHGEPFHLHFNPIILVAREAITERLTRKPK